MEKGTGAIWNYPTSKSADLEYAPAAAKGSVLPEELEALRQVSQALAGKLQLELVLGGALKAMEKVLDAAGSSVLLVEPANGVMSFHVAGGPDSAAAKSIPVPPGAGICGHVARTGEAVIVNDAQNDPRLFRQIDSVTKITTRNLLAVPIRGHQGLLGVLELINKKQGGGFTAHDLRVAEVAANQLAMALANARLHGQIVRQERLAAIGQTVSGLAHCIKNILNGIRSGSAVIDRSMRNEDHPRVREGWQVVRKNNAMLGNLVLDMLSLARESKPNPFPTDVNDLAEQVCRLLAERAAERKISVVFTAGSGVEDVLLDPTHIYRCLLNLASNAVEACGEGGRVHVRVRRGAGRDRFTLSVLDNGSGIPREVQARIFQEFFTTKGGAGTGLGLPVTRKLIQEMGGTIVFHSAPERGTRFVIALPIAVKPRDPPENSA